MAILFLIKFFEAEEYADALLRGELYLNRLSYFQDAEAHSHSGRADRNEAVAAWLQPEKVVIEFKDHPELNITPQDLGGPVSLAYDKHRDIHLYCMTAMRTGEFEVKDGHILCVEENLERLREQLTINPRCLELGKIAVVARAREFVDRVMKATKAHKYAFASALVEYYDPAVFHGRFPDDRIPFMKSAEFGYQNEYRFAIHTGSYGADPLRLNIGELSDIAFMMPSENLTSAFQLKLEPS